MHTPRVLFARIGHMEYYEGQQPGDERPVAGGKYNKKNIGHEVYNFKNVHGYLYGYFQPYYRKHSKSPVTVNLGRIDPSTKKAAHVDGVLVIFVATTPDNGQAIVGWYRDGARNRI